MSLSLNFNAYFFQMTTDSIEANVESAETHVEQGNVQLQQARASQVSYNLWLLF